MFYPGDLRSGIALALQEAKPVACFVVDQSPESAAWQSSHLVDEQVTRALNAKAITLRIEAASEEAGNGHLLLELRAGTPQHEFKAAILRALSSTPSATNPISISQTSSQDLSRDERLSESTSPEEQINTPLNSPADSVSAITSTSSHTRAQNSNATASDATPSAAISSSDVQQGSVVERLLSERRSKLEKKKEENDAALKAERKAKAKERAATLGVDPKTLDSKQAQYAQQRRQRETEARAERERVLRLIEHDKAERKEREEQRKRTAIVETANHSGTDRQEHGQPPILDPAQQRILKHRSSMSSSDCSLQIRLMDGSSIRSRFLSTDTLGSNVKPWIDRQRSDGGTPYSLKQILSPAPNRTLSITEERNTLQELGLLPTCTLVLVPIHGYTTVYNQNNGIVSKGLSTCYNGISAVVKLIMTVLLALLEILHLKPSRRTMHENEQDAQHHNLKKPTPGTTSGIKIHGLRDQRDRDEKQYYNGNQLNFEPREDDDEKK
ncbi:uncharacterized protein KY384_001099 [Bacidia gigantensis]|uniref:uncharacterized protein n=1 Tax=Bacidia gigantensis TaxID=2732470 RepID=UPI001D03FFC6|nr:uncharacterized protein KY384_001099 [Bacidia gigantensis]KAG8534255.1 hypothetical protein KY384_001099 [Bacidia gigantensis]